MKAKYDKKTKLIEENFGLLRQKTILQEKCFSISALHDTKPSGILYNLGDGVRKSDFPVPSEHHISALSRQLDSLVKIFAVTVPYNAIGLVENNVYVSLSQPINLDIAPIIRATLELIRSDLHSNSCIPAVSRFYQALYESGNHYVRKIIDIKHVAFLKQHDIDSTDIKAQCDFAALDHRLFFKYFTSQDIGNIINLNIERLEFTQVRPTIDELHIHAELNLVVTIIQTHGRNTPISIGLASSNIFDVPGCCGLCTATLNSVSRTLELEIYRTRDFPQNMPKGHWDFPYKLLDTAFKSFLFFVNIVEQYRPIVVDRSLGNVEAFENLERKVGEYKEFFDDMKDLEARITSNEQQILVVNEELAIMGDV